MCLLFHHYTSWGHIQEIPVWKNDTGDKSLGFQPLKEQLYNIHGVVEKRFEPDHQYRLIGKILEQRRHCQSCGFIQINKQKWTV